MLPQQCIGRSQRRVAQVTVSIVVSASPPVLFVAGRNHATPKVTAKYAGIRPISYPVLMRAGWAAIVTFASGCIATSDISRGKAHALVGDGGLLVDVRAPNEFAERHPPEAVNLPLDTLSTHYATLDKQRPLIVYCHTGVRAAIATRRLRKAGFTVYNLGTLGHWYYEGSGPAPTFQ
jgi:rhodanese-related sulfurtransferase